MLKAELIPLWRMSGGIFVLRPVDVTHRGDLFQLAALDALSKLAKQGASHEVYPSFL